MTTRSSQIAAGITTGSGQTLLYTVPGSEAVILKSAVIGVQNGDPTPQTAALDLQPAGSGITIYLAFSQTISTNEPMTWSGWIVLEPTDNLYVIASSRLAYVLSGAILPLP